MLSASRDLAPGCRSLPRSWRPAMALPRRCTPGVDPLVPEVHVSCEGKYSSQRGYLQALKDESVKTVICFGNPGTGKTYVAVAVALQWLRQRKCRKLYLLRPAADKSLLRSGNEGDHEYACRLNRPALDCVRSLAFPEHSRQHRPVWNPGPH